MRSGISFPHPGNSNFRLGALIYTEVADFCDMGGSWGPAPNNGHLDTPYLACIDSHAGILRSGSAQRWHDVHSTYTVAIFELCQIAPLLDGNSDFQGSLALTWITAVHGRITQYPGAQIQPPQCYPTDRLLCASSTKNRGVTVLDIECLILDGCILGAINYGPASSGGNLDGSLEIYLSWLNPLGAHGYIQVV